MAPSRRNSETAKYLCADIPRVTADDRFIAVLADLAGSSTPASDRSRIGKTALRVKLAAVTASVAMVSVGAAYAVDQFGGEERSPVEDTDTVDPARPSETDQRYENRNEDPALHHSDEGREEHHQYGGTRNGDQDDSGLPANGLEGSTPEAPVPQGQTGQDDPPQQESGPNDNDPDGSDTPDDADTNPDVDPDDPDSDADESDAEEADAGDDPDADRDPELDD